ncbi:MAG: isoprenylcysteine carboxylmethyltransferase family protein [Saprospiraceae bacterium]|uniref:Isoprenylcysteine carboxylmethyltransferase family protein n=1 Tax=Candidatus Opimibacter skivensis TaxID=2982028 RepID=A0A9D7SW67_9BACT|nr:isoprenylcysteine carboxylmethyltransferase family protein [Candidatus Opimibacter skivensis]
MNSLLYRNLLFTILQPGLVAGLIPYLIIEDKLDAISYQPIRLFQYAGVIIFLTGAFLVLYCIYYFAVEGRGTLSPADPTQRLVVHGPYRLSRNPMYIGVTMALLGEVIVFISSSLLIYCGIIFLMFNLFVLLVEEPRLKRDFGEEYISYSRKVRRWI